MIGIWQDVRFAFRMLLKHRFATLVCAGRAGLGIGANTAIFSMAEAFLLHPVPLERSRTSVVAMVDSRPEQNVEIISGRARNFLEWQSQANPSSKLSSMRGTATTSPGDTSRKKFSHFLVTANFFRPSGVQPQLGRDFLAEEGKPGKNQELILSHALWERRYASDPQNPRQDREGQRTSVTVVGVMAKGFDYPMRRKRGCPWVSMPKRGRIVRAAGSWFSAT